MLDNRVGAVFMPHGLGHFIGTEFTMWEDTIKDIPKDAAKQDSKVWELEEF